mgnify:CR=1 FL=1
MNYYGYGSPEQVKEVIEHVCSKFHTAKRRAMTIAAFAAVETQFGTYPDSCVEYGTSILQYDPIRFEDIKARTRKKNKDLVLREFGVDIDLVDLCCLRYNILLAVIFAILALLLIKEALPYTMEGIYAYWKKYWNSKEGKGTLEHFTVSYNKWRHLIEG